MDIIFLTRCQTQMLKAGKNVTDQLKTVSPISGYNSYNFDYLDAYQKMGMRGETCYKSVS